MRRLCVGLVLCVLLASQAHAQIPVLRAADPGATQQRQMDEERRRREEEREQLPPVADPLRREAIPAPPTEQAPAAQDAVRFLVREIHFTKSEILTADELAAVASEFEGKELALADLKRLTARINAIYQRKGVVTAQAILPPQDISSGIVQIRLVEGRLGKIMIDGNETTNADYIADRLGIRPEELMDLGTLEAALIRFNRTNDVQLQSEIKPGDQFATTDLFLQAREPQRHDLRLIFDNLGNTTTGVNRTSLNYLNRSLFGFRDDLALSVTGAGGQQSGSINYGFPVNRWGGRFSLGYYHDETQVKYGSLSSLHITGKSTATVYAFRQPTFVDSSKQLDVIVGGKSRKTTNWIDDIFLQTTDTQDGSLGLEGQYYERDSNWFASYTRSFGNAKVSNFGNSDYVINRGTVRYFRDLGGDYAFRASASWQSTNNVVLPSSEQFFIGGEGSVRGYQVGLYAGDTGQMASVEFHHPLLSANTENGEIKATGFFFLDYGRVKPYRPPNSLYRERETLTGAGWGMLANITKHAYARVTFGYGLEPVPEQPRPRCYSINFQLVASAF